MRLGLFTSTALATLSLLATNAEAADKAPPRAAVPLAKPAVSALNGKLSVQGGADNDLPAYRAIGSLSLPLGTEFGFQADGLVGSLDDRFEGAFGGHLFWRNPDFALLGVYANYGYADRLGGIEAATAAAEAELYWNRFTASGIAGYQLCRGGGGQAQPRLLPDRRFPPLRRLPLLRGGSG
jgi:hypothetical protein